MSARNKSGKNNDIIESRRQSRSGNIDPSLFENPFENKRLFTAGNMHADSQDSERPRVVHHEPVGVTYAVAEMEELPVPTASVVYNSRSSVLGSVAEKTGGKGDDRNQKQRGKKSNEQYEHGNGATHGTEEGISTWPASLCKQLLKAFQTAPDAARADAFLSKYNWPQGIKDTIIKCCKKIAMRFFIVDDSGERTDYRN